MYFIPHRFISPRWWSINYISPIIMIIHHVIHPIALPTAYVDLFTMFHLLSLLIYRVVHHPSGCPSSMMICELYFTYNYYYSPCDSPHRFAHRQRWSGNYISPLYHNNSPCNSPLIDPSLMMICLLYLTCNHHNWPCNSPTIDPSLMIIC